MKISDILKRPGVSVSFEVFPPKKDAPLAPVKDAVSRLAALGPSFISVTYGAGGGASANTASIASFVQNDCRTTALAHLTCVGATRADIDSAIVRLRAAGIENVLALRGDLPAGEQGNAGLRNVNEASGESAFLHASDLVPLLKSAGFCVGGACYPEGHPESANRDQDLDNLVRKVEAGCDFLTTQMFFENDMLYTFLYRLRSRGVKVPVLAGIMPVTSPKQVTRMLALSNAFMPRRLLALIDRFKDSPDALRQAGIAYATEQIIDLISNGVAGIHIYSMNRPDVAAALVANISSIIKA